MHENNDGMTGQFSLAFSCLAWGVIGSAKKDVEQEALSSQIEI